MPATDAAPGLHLIGFDGDDTLWRSQDYFEQAQLEFEQILAPYVDLSDRGLRDHLYEVEVRNIAVFGYGVKGMALSMIEAAVAMTGQRITGSDVHRIVELAKRLLRHPVELLPGIREAVSAIGADYEIVLITKGDLFHQEAKVRQSGLSDLFKRIEIVSEKDVPTYARVLAECGVTPQQFAMIGNSLRSDIAPVLALGGWGVHMPYHSTWVHEEQADIPRDAPRLRQVDAAAALPAAVRELARSATQAPEDTGG